GGADACTHAAQRVGAQNGMRRPANVVVRDSANETRNIDAGRAGGLARRLKAVVAAVCLDPGLRQVQGGVRVTKILLVVSARQTGGVDTGRGRINLHVRLFRFGGVVRGSRKNESMANPSQGAIRCKNSAFTNW